MEACGLYAYILAGRPSGIHYDPPRSFALSGAPSTGLSITTSPPIDANSPVLAALQELLDCACTATVTDLAAIADDPESTELAALIARIAATDHEAAQPAADMCWRRLKAPGGWPDMVWKEAHIESLLTLAWTAHQAGEHAQAMRQTDIALIFGAPRGVSDVFVKAIEPLARAATTSAGAQQLAPTVLPQQLVSNLGLLPSVMEHTGAMSVSQFQKAHYKKAAPVVLRGAVKHWSAVQQWNQLDWIR